MYIVYTNKEMDIGIKLLRTCDVGAFQDISAVHEVCSNGTSAQSARHIPVSKRASCTFAYISPFTCLQSFFTCFKQILCLRNLALGQEAVHNVT